MTQDRRTRRLNNHLGAELGREATGNPFYKWIWSEDKALLHPMRSGQEYKANLATGLIEIVPTFTLRKMCLIADRQWVLCHWIESPSEMAWRESFGYELEWPKGGQFYPTSVTLDPGIEPDDRLTQTVIDCIREMRNKTGAQVEREATEAVEKKEAATKQQLFEEIREACTTYDHVPGRKDGVSYSQEEDYGKVYSQ